MDRSRSPSMLNIQVQSCTASLQVLDEQHHMNMYIPAGGSAHSITMSARAVSPLISRQNIIFLPFIGSVLCIKCSLALAALFLLSSGMSRPMQRPLRSLVLSNIFLALSGVKGSAVGRDDDIITTTHTHTQLEWRPQNIVSSSRKWGSGSGHTYPNRHTWISAGYREGRTRLTFAHYEDGFN